VSAYFDPVNSGGYFIPFVAAIEFSFIIICVPIGEISFQDDRV
jgi:hypothetical protein